MIRRLAITGALGHIGSRFIHSIEPGEFDEVLLVDNFATQRYASLFHLPARVSFHFVEADICAVDLEKLFAGIEVVVHLAAITDATTSFGRAAEVDAVNVGGTERVAAACVATGAALLFPSTTSVYGVQAGVVDESCPPEQLLPQSPYAESKLRCERLLAEQSRQGLRCLILRLGTIFGTSIGMRFHTAVNKFCFQAVMGLPLSVWRTAYEQQRPYCDLGDAISAMRFLLARGQFDGQIYNVVTRNASVRDIVEVIRRFLPETTVSFVDERIMNQLSYTVSNAKLQRLGFSFTGDLSAGIAETLRLLAAANGKIL